MKALFYNSQGGEQIVPRGIIESNCQLAGFEQSTIRDELARLVNEGELRIEADL